MYSIVLVTRAERSGLVGDQTRGSPERRVARPTAVILLRPATTLQLCTLRTTRRALAIARRVQPGCATDRVLIRVAARLELDDIATVYSARLPEDVTAVAACNTAGAHSRSRDCCEHLDSSRGRRSTAATPAPQTARLGPTTATRRRRSVSSSIPTPAAMHGTE